MANLLQHGQHPDADQLNAFMEKASPEHERLATLAHLAECKECRDIVFLAQRDLLPVVQVAAESDSQPWWRVWRRPLLVAGIGFACLFLLVVSVGVQRFLKNQNKPMYDARNEATNLPSAATQSQLAKAPAKPQTVGTPGAELSAMKSQEKSVAPAMRGQLRRTLPESSASHPVGGVGSGFADGVAGGILGGIGTAPGIAVGGPQASPLVPSPPTALAMRKQDVAPAPQASATGGTAADFAAQPINGSSVARLLTTEGPLRLTIEHGQGADSGLSELRGTVRDPAGAVIPRATINLRGLSAQADANTASDAGGEFTVASLPPGQYEIEVSSAGFQSLKQRINLQARDVAQIDPVLPVGSAAQTVTITAQATVLQSESGAIASTIKKSPESAFVSQTALNGTLLAFDTSGRLFRKGPGDKNWKKVRPKWHDAVVKLSTSPESEQGALAASFLITTSSGDSWASPDGRHWKRR